MGILVKNMSFKEGNTLTVVAVPDSDTASFAVNIGHDSDNYALHFNPRMAARRMVLNSLSGGNWQEEQHADNFFPFKAGEYTKMEFSFNKETFSVALEGGKVSFPNRLGYDKFWHIHFSGEGRAVSVSIK